MSFSIFIAVFSALVAFAVLNKFVFEKEEEIYSESNVNYFFGDPNLSSNPRPLNDFQRNELGIFANPYAWSQKEGRWINLQYNIKTKKLERVKTESAH